MSKAAELRPMASGVLDRQSVQRVHARGWTASRYRLPDDTLTLAALFSLALPKSLKGHRWAAVRVREWSCRAAEAAAFAIEPLEREVPGDVVTLADNHALDLAATAPVPGRDAVARGVAHEILVNALVHRSFEEEFLEQPVILETFTDGFTVRSPGTSLEAASPTGFSRNPVLHGLVAALGHAHQQGGGLRYVARSARHVGWAVERKDEDGWHRVDVRVHLDLVDAALAGDTRHRVSMKDGEARVLAVLDDVPRTRSEIVELVGLPATTVGAHLRVLKERGLARQTRTGIRSRYQSYVRGGGPSSTSSDP